MSAKYLSGMVYSTFRQARSSTRADWCGSYRSIEKRWFSTLSGKVSDAATQRLEFVKVDNKGKDLVCPVRFFKEEVDFLKSLDTNELLRKVGKQGRSEVSDKAARAVRSLAEMMLESHAKGVPMGDCPKLSNCLISRSLGKFAMIEPPKDTSKYGSLLADFGRLADIVEELGRLVLEPTMLMPSVWVNFTEKLREEFPKVELIMYHSLFMTHNQRYWLKMFVDQHFRKDFGALQKKQKDAIRHFLTALGKKCENDDLLLLFDRDQVLKFVSFRSRQGSRGRRGQRNSDLSKPEAVFGEQARDIIAINRDGVVHGCKCDPSKKEIAAMPGIKKSLEDSWKGSAVAAEQFDLLEQTILDLCHDKDKHLWKIIRVWEMFGETEDTWRLAMEAIAKEVESMKAARLEKGRG